MSACPGDRHVFKCVALHSHNVEWVSEVYIESPLQIVINSPVSTPLHASRNTDSYVILESVAFVNGTLQLTSSLNIVVSSSIREQNHTVACLNNDLGTLQSITFQVAGMYTDVAADTLVLQSLLFGGSGALEVIPLAIGFPPFNLILGCPLLEVWHKTVSCAGFTVTVVVYLHPLLQKLVRRLQPLMSSPLHT